MARENFFEAGRPKVLEPYPDWLFQWFDQHAIGARVVEKFGVHAAIYRDSDCIAFPYRAGETVLGKKIRSRKTDKQTFDGASPAAFFGAHMLAEGAITWADDEMAVLAFAECGVDNVIGGCSVDGLKTHDDVIGRAPRIVLAGATDKPGLVLREEMARRLGRHRCWLAAWPDGCKDAGQTLRDRGPDAVLAALQAAQPYPIDGVQRISAAALLALRGRPAPVTMTTGALATDRILKLPTEGRLIVVTGWPGAGKAMALDTLVPTPTGWTTMGELRDDDEVYSADGSITRVLKAHPVMHNRSCYKVVFNDETSFTCDAEHLWLTHTAAARTSEQNQKKNRDGREELKLRGTDQRHRRVLPTAMTTRDIAKTLKVPDGPNNPLRFNHSITIASSITGRGSWPLKTKPYTFGAWLGDGHKYSAALFSADAEVPEEIRKDGYDVRKGNGKDPVAWYIQGLKPQLRADGVLFNKHIPSACLRAPTEDRLALLQGLMDTDGYAAANGSAEFCSMNSALAESVLELVRTMGIKAMLRRGRATLNGKDCGEKHRVCFTTSGEVFRLPRKRDRAAAQPRLKSRCGNRIIVSVEPTESVPVRCISVDHPSHLYLVGEEFVPTHNTVWLRYVMVHTARHHGRRWAVFSPEMQPWEQFAAECAEVYSGKPFYPTPGVDSMTETEIGEAGDWLSGKVTMLVCDAEDQAPTLEWIMERARATVLRDGVTDLVIDPWNEVDLLRTERQVETEAIGRALQRLKAFGQRHGCNVWIIAHPAKPPPLKPNETRGAPGLYDLAGSAHFANKSDLGIVVNSPVPGFADLHLVKARFRRFGTKNTVAKLEYNALNGTYSTPAGGPSQEGHQPAHWQDFDDGPLAGGLS